MVHMMVHFFHTKYNNINTLETLQKPTRIQEKNAWDGIEMTMSIHSLAINSSEDLQAHNPAQVTPFLFFLHVYYWRL